MVCPNCRTAVQPGSRFCNGCGAPLAAPQAAQPTQQWQQQQPGQPSAQPTQQWQQPAQQWQNPSAGASQQTVAPWDEVTEAAGENALRGREAIGQFMGALHQVMNVGSESQKARALDVVNDARRRLYGILADDPAAE